MMAKPETLFSILLQRNNFWKDIHCLYMQEGQPSLKKMQV